MGFIQSLLQKLKAYKKRSCKKRERHPGKCQIVNGDPSTNCRLYGESIEQVAWFNYLGIPFCSTGIEVSRLINHNATKTTDAMRVLWSLGAHQYSFGLGVTLRLYRSFIRPFSNMGWPSLRLPQQISENQTSSNTLYRLALNITAVSARTPTIQDFALEMGKEARVLNPRDHSFSF
ncbi:hypothetical protein BDB00DRAFT_880120 [Zychaea mexicana]|uniref:uncharacterized protein n=1 Tax=Zychaea mexicana TaxID=64656 RepID=UPI0022FE57C2|nr:uncharacterized protein BDB00DRAFT_880120 [Zychaea mexicana]KAI9470436.1 hypothetical protein BDB00DRAFT_880120 [Zychaea mexicana]